MALSWAIMDVTDNELPITTDQDSAEVCKHKNDNFL